MTLDEVMDRLHQLADPQKVEFKKKKFGVVAHNSIGVYHKDLKALAKEIGADHELALQLFDSGLYEGRLLCSKLFRPKHLTEDLMEKWTATFENWEICDSFCMAIYARSSFAVQKAIEWTEREPEFEKRSGFVIMAAYCMADKKADNAVFEVFFPLIIREAKDERIYVKKAVNWALRNIGKRNIDLHRRASEVAREILDLNNKTANWIAKDALREFEKKGLNVMGYPRSIYKRTVVNPL
ncbi:MAG: DNA alkylation repair protein [Saprospiraceae bacterium]|nr:DNA alkylation repair protein [Saprospiraceae bacterium]